MVMCSHESFVSLSGKVFTTSGGWRWVVTQEELNCRDKSSVLLEDRRFFDIFPVKTPGKKKKKMFSLWSSGLVS